MKKNTRTQHTAGLLRLGKHWSQCIKEKNPVVIDTPISQLNCAQFGFFSRFKCVLALVELGPKEFGRLMSKVLVYGGLYFFLKS